MLCGHGTMIVCKFGGTSVAGENSFTNIKNIVCENANRKIIVVSALGKNAEHCHKITDKLFELYYLLQNGENGEEVLDYIFFRYEQMSSKMGVDINWQKHKQNLQQKRRKKGSVKLYYFCNRKSRQPAILLRKS